MAWVLGGLLVVVIGFVVWILTGFAKGWRNWFGS